MYDSDYDESVKDYKKELEEWLIGQKNWEDGFYIDYYGKKLSKKELYEQCLESIEEDRKKYNFDQKYRAEEKEKYKTGFCSYEDIVGNIPTYPSPEDYMPTGEWYQLFETVSEGTPLTPPFETPQELIEWLTNNEDYWGNRWSKDGAESIVGTGFAMSAVVSGGKIYKPEEQHLLKKD